MRTNSFEPTQSLTPGMNDDPDRERQKQLLNATAEFPRNLWQYWGTPELDRVDLNPVLVSVEGAWVVGATVHVAPAAPFPVRTA